jgi:acetyltransferase-like isoleucine patch superfamily enzyme
MGTGSQIIQGLTVGVGTIVGAGACVVKDILSEVTAVGCPAKVIKKNNV